MYFPFVIATMLVLPLASVGIDLWQHPDSAGIGNVGQKDRSANENLALWTDLLISVVPLAFIIWSVA